MPPLAIKLLRWLGLILVATIVIDLGARLLVSAIPFIGTLLIFVLIFGLLFGFFRASK